MSAIVSFICFVCQKLVRMDKNSGEMGDCLLELGTWWGGQFALWPADDSPNGLQSL